MYRYDATNFDPAVWDDTELIRAYESAVTTFDKKCKVDANSNSSPKFKTNKRASSAAKTGSSAAGVGGGACHSVRKSPSQSASAEERVLVWNVGDRCSACYSEDGELYPAEIISIKGNACFVRLRK